MNIAVVDAGANLVAFVRMDGAWLGSLDISIKKAKTARFFDMNTGIIGELSQPGQPLFNIEHSNNGLITFPATTQANVTFSTTGLSVQQVYRLTTNTFDSVIVSGNVQEVGESLELSFDRSANVFVSPGFEGFFSRCVQKIDSVCVCLCVCL